MNDNNFTQMAHDILEDYTYAYSKADEGVLAKYIQTKFYEYRAEAIKEFAERIEPKLANKTDISAVGYQSVIAIIDNLVKEMTEDNG